MDDIIQYLIAYGYTGMGVAAFVAGSVFPFSSETLLAGLQLAGLQPWPLFASATIGNVLGSVLNYALGRMGKMEWIEKYLHVKKEDLGRIFDRFYRADESRNSETGGHGIGLSVAKAVTDQHGGRIKADLTDGGLFTVTVTLPG